MEENYISPILYEIFPHLQSTEPTTAAEYSRIRKSSASLVDKKSRESFCYILDKLIVHVGLRWIFQDREIKKHYNDTLFVGISFNNLQHEINAPLERPCCNEQFNCFVVDLTSRYDVPISENSDSVFEILFPIKDWSDVTILSYINRRLAFKYSSNAIYLDKGDFNQALHFLAQLQNFFTEKCLLSRIVIIFCRETCYPKFLRLLRIFSLWFAFYRMTIWIAVVNEITICRYNFGNHYCKIDTQFLFMFINNPSYKAHINCLYSNCDTPEKIRTHLTHFREEVGSFTGSIAFMHVSEGRMKEFYYLDTMLFREVFPEVFLLPFYGKASYIGHCFFHLSSFLMPLYKKPQIKHTAILIILGR